MFVPSVGHFAQGMLVCIPLACGHAAPAAMRAALLAHYDGSRHVAVCGLPESGTLDPQALNDTDKMQLFVAGDADHPVLIARLDNLGKGAAGAAVQNLHLMLGEG
jgi:N-acetyl-gamma-glutamyl-phosphate reductase